MYHRPKPRPSTIVILATMALSPLIIGADGCLIILVNRPPVADAGGNQIVTPGSTVTLNGSGSTDPDGDRLSFSWRQTAGTSVTLHNAETAIANFVAPDTTGTLTFRLTVEDPRGETDSATVDVTVSLTLTPVLFIANSLGNSIITYADPSTINGDVAPTTDLVGLLTTLASPMGLALDAHGALLVANYDTRTAIAFDKAVTVSGNVKPDRAIPVSSLWPTDLAIDRANDLLFVSNVNFTPSIAVYANASTADGFVNPVHVITSTALSNPRGLFLDESDNLYVADNGTSPAVLVFASASALDGQVSPTRTIIASPPFTAPVDVFVDDDDHLFVADAAGPPRIRIFQNASTIKGVVSPHSTLIIPGATRLSSIVVDSAGRGYIADGVVPGSVYSYNDIATLDGTVPPTRTISGSDTRLNRPSRLLLLGR